MRFKAKLAPEQVSLLHSIIVPMTRRNGGGGSNHDTTTTSMSRSNNNRSSSYSSQQQHNVGVSSSSLLRNGTIFYFDNDHVRISCKGNHHSNMDTASSSTGSGGITCFVELNAHGYTSIFLDRRIESVAPNNAIVMEIDIQQLRIALKSVLYNNNNGNNSTAASCIDYNSIDAQQRYVVIKLAKRQNIPCLCIDACTISSSTTSSSNNNNININHRNCCTIQVHHAIPVRILRHTEMIHHLPPSIQRSNQSSTLQLEIVPSSYNLRNVIDRLKHISSTIYLDANDKGELTISAHTNGASIQTYFSKFIPRFDNDDNENGSPTTRLLSSQRKTTATKSTRIKMDTKKLAASLQWQNTSSSSSNQLVSSALLCLIENEMVVVHVNLYPIHVGFITYYVPVHYLSNDPYDD